MQNKRIKSQDLTRQKIINAARNLFATEGEKGASIDKIVANAGFSKGAFYSNFKSKNDLLFELLANHKKQAIENLAMFFQEDTSDLLISLSQYCANFPSNRVFLLLEHEFSICAVRSLEFAPHYLSYCQEFEAEFAIIIERTLKQMNRNPKIDYIDIARIIKQVNFSDSLRIITGTQQNNASIITLLKSFSKKA